MKTNSVGVFKAFSGDYEISVKDNISYYFCCNCEVHFATFLLLFSYTCCRSHLDNNSFYSLLPIKKTPKLQSVCFWPNSCFSQDLAKLFESHCTASV